MEIYLTTKQFVARFLSRFKILLICALSRQNMFGTSGGQKTLSFSETHSYKVTIFIDENS